MYSIRRLIAIVLIAVIGLQLYTPMTTLAAESDEYYTELFSTKAAPYMITCQSDSALVLSDTVDLVPDMKSPNYYGGVVDLPRLSSDYYYSLGGNTNYYLGKTVYPVLCWKSDAIGQSVTLNIKSYQGKRTLASFTISISGTFKEKDYRDNDAMAGTDYHYPTTDIMSKPAEGEDESVLVPKRDFVDASKDIMSKLISAGDDLHIYNGTDYQLKLYDSSLHKSSIIMPTYAITGIDDILDQFSYEPSSVESLAYPFIREDTGSRGITVSLNLHDYIEEFSSGSPREALVFLGSKFEECIFDGNTGDCTTVTLPTDTDDLYYFIGIGSEYFFGKVSTDSTDTDAFSQVSETAPKMVWEADRYYRMRSMSSRIYGDDLYKQFGLLENPEHPYLRYGPINFDNFWKADSGYGIQLRSGAYAFQHSVEETTEEFNVFAETLIYAGCIPHLGSLTLKAADSKATVNYYYQKPDSSSGKWELLDTVTYNVDNFSEDLMPKLPALENYDTTGWYLDTSLQNAFTVEALKSQSGTKTVNLYAGYTYSGGTYKVIFYNDKTGKTEEKEFKLSESVVLPDRPESGPGYSFKNWVIVTNQTDASGVEYSPSTFVPVKGNTYIFKTMWDVKGIIIKVMTNKTQYYVGEEIDKSFLKVYVQDTEDASKTRILEDDEYTIDNPIVDKTGIFQFHITYIASGAIATCEITGLPDSIEKLVATYKGGDNVVVGTTLKKTHFDVRLQYTSKKMESITDFDFNPKTLTKTGNVVVTITHAEFSTKITLKVIKDENVKVRLKSLSASYTGKALKVGSKLKASDLLVVALYDDGSSRTLKSTEFKYTPNKFTTAGKQSIVITHDGISTTIKITIEGNTKPEEKPTPTPQPTPQPTQTPTPQPTPTPGGNGNGSGAGSGSGHFSDNKDNKNDKNDNGGNKSNGSTKSASNDSDEKGPSPGYLSAATILTNTLGYTGSIPDNTIDIDKLLEESGEAGDINLVLVNGANGNDITPSMLTKIKSKRINLNIAMVTPTDSTCVVASWVLRGTSLDNTSVTVSPNVTFELTEKDTDKLLYMAISDVAYPAGIELTLYPEIKYFPSGDIVRVYSCDMLKNNSKLLQTTTWADVTNPVKVNFGTSKIYCLSNSMEAYKDGSSLLSTNGLPSEVDTDDAEYEDGYDFNSENDEEDIVSEDDSSYWEEEETSQSSKKSFPKWIILAVIVAIVLLLIITTVLTFLLKRRNYDDSFVGDDQDDYED